MRLHPTLVLVAASLAAGCPATPGDTSFVSLSCSPLGLCAVDGEGAAQCAMTLGNGWRPSPFDGPFVEAWAATNSLACALDAEGRASCWNPSDDSKVEVVSDPIRSPSRARAVRRSDGRIVDVLTGESPPAEVAGHPHWSAGGWRAINPRCLLGASGPSCPDLLNLDPVIEGDFVEFAGYDHHLWARRDDGTVARRVYDPTTLQLGAPEEVPGEWLAVAGTDAVCGLRVDLSVECFEDLTYDEPILQGFEPDVAARLLCAERSRACIVDADSGAITCWGEDPAEPIP